MFCKVYSADISGIDAYKVCVEVDVSQGLPCFNMVGLPSSEVREAKERVERAITNSAITFPPRKVTINLSPANIRKQGSGFDLPIAIGILAAAGSIKEKALEGILFVGELSLDGSINAVKGILPIAMMAKKQGFHTIVVPEENVFEGAAVDGIRIHGAKDLLSLIKQLNLNMITDIEHIDMEDALEEAYQNTDLDFSDVNGQEKAKIATMTAVAGFHNLMYIGPPGSGKSMLAERIPTILGKMTKNDCLEVSAIYSISGLLKEDSLVLTRPFRAPHQSITRAGLCGGTARIKPGEITLAHKGVLFMDELSEFQKSTIDDLRAPLENKKIVINRAGNRVVYPCDFMLVAATNPCRCGFYPDRRYCTCSEEDVKRYFGKIQGPILDRIDITVGVSKVAAGDLQKGFFGMSSSEMRERIVKAQDIQKERFKDSKTDFNSRMDKDEIEKFCITGKKGMDILKQAYEKYNMTARGYYKILKVARTIADLDEREEISAGDILQALGYRNVK